MPLASAAISDRARKRSGVPVLMFVVFLLIGGGLTYYMLVRTTLLVHAARQWFTVPCTVLSSEVKTHSDSDGSTYSIDIHYSYEYAQKRYESDRYDFLGGSSSGQSGKQAVVNQYPVGSQRVCYVNPADPTQAVLNRGYTAGMWFGLIPLAFFVIGLVGLLARLRGGSSSSPFEQRAISGPTSGLAAKLQQRLARKHDAYDWLPQMRFEQPVLLETKASSHVTAGVIILVFALLWNGFVFGFLVREVAQSFSRGDPDYCQALFSVPFVLAGLAMLGFSAYMFLRAFNPRPLLTVSRAIVPIGGSFDLEWRLEGNISRVQDLTIDLVGTEEVTYRRGTDTRTDRHTLRELPIAHLEAGSGDFSGRAHVEMPPDLMHSFDASNNKIVWNLRVRGTIPRWPDISETYVIALVPPELLASLQEEPRA